jgi:hypothetical protein
MQQDNGPLESGPEETTTIPLRYQSTKSFAEESCAALTYARNGWRVFPLHSPQVSGCSCGQSDCSKAGKHPRITNWQQDASNDPATVAAWWSQWPDANIGLRLDDLIVMDVDVAAGKGGAESLAKLEAEHGMLDRRARQKTGSGGEPFLFRAVPDVQKRIKFEPGLDLLTGVGHYIVVEPSVHATGGRYQWMDEINPLIIQQDAIALTAPPAWLLDAASNQKPACGAARPGAERVPVERIMAKAIERVQSGSSRNDAGLWLFVQMRDNRYSRDETELVLREWVNKANEAAPGHRYTLREAEATLRQAYKRDAREPWEKDNRPSQADLLLKLAADFEYFKSGPANDAYVRMPIGDHKEIWRVDSRSPKVREILTHRYLTQNDRAPSREALNTVIDTVVAKCGVGPKVDVHVRFARGHDAIYLDLADDRWRAIEVTRDGWRVVEDPPVCFKRPSGARPLPVPLKGGTLDLVRPLLNAADDSQWCLMAGWVVGAFLPEGAFGHLVLEGEQGSAKSTTARVLQCLLDPSDAGLSAPPKDETDATVSALHAGILAYDNLSGCRADIADVFCRFSTGQGYRTRTLYENLSVTVASVKLPILLNGIDTTGDAR